MSQNNFEANKSASFEYVLNYKANDFYSYNYENVSKEQCRTLKDTNACDVNGNSKQCFESKLCDNKALADKALTIIASNNESQTRQTDGSLVFDQAIQNCITLSVGIVAMFITMGYSAMGAQLKK
jgi:hypothetical protein